MLKFSTKNSFMERKTVAHKDLDEDERKRINRIAFLCVSSFFNHPERSQYNAIHVHFPDEGVEDEKSSAMEFAFDSFSLSSSRFLFFLVVECEVRKKNKSLWFVCAVWFLITFNDIFYAKFCIQLKFICLIKFPSAAIPRIFSLHFFRLQI